MVVGWTIRVRARSRRWTAALSAVSGFGLYLAQSAGGLDAGDRSMAGHLARLLAWAGVLAAVTLLTAGVWWLLPLCLPVSFVLRLQ